MPATLLEEELQQFLRAGWLALVWKVKSENKILESVHLLDRDALEEFAHPGRASDRRRALTAAQASLCTIAHPVAGDIARLLAQPEAATWGSEFVRALEAVALHAETGEQLAQRVFSTHYLGSSKALARLRSRIERILGQKIEALNIREGAAVTLLGGDGHMRVEGQSLELAALRPFIGFARETFGEDIEVKPPRGGLLLVENLAVFDACCRREIAGLDETMVVWTAGYPGRAVRSIVEHASRLGARIRVWADLDLDGVRIARLVRSWTPSSVEQFRMSPVDLAAAPRKIRLGDRARRAIRAELETSPDAFLADTLAAMLEAEAWAEQECFLGRVATDNSAT